MSTPERGLDAKAVPTASFGESDTAQKVSSFHREIAASLSRDVDKMIQQAKHDSEYKVKAELHSIRGDIDAVTEKLEALGTINSQKEKTANLHAPENAVDKRTLTEFVQKIEHRWMMEMSTLKQELHQTILAHNHNADLMKHLKDAMDHIRTQLDDRNVPHIEQWVRCMPRIDEVLRQTTLRDRQVQALPPKLESLLVRVETLESQMLSLPQASFSTSMGAVQQTSMHQLTDSQRTNQQQVWPMKVNSASPAPSFQMMNRWPDGQTGQPNHHKESRKEVKQNQGDKEKKDDKEKLGESLRAAAPVFVPKSSDGGSSKDKNQRKLSPQQSASPQSMDKVGNVGAPPGLPPPPGLSMDTGMQN